MPLHFLADADASLHRDGDASLASTATLAQAQPADVIILRGSEAHHAAVVRRVRTGEAVTVGDGAGTWITGEVADSAPKQVAVRVDHVTAVPQSEPRLVLVQALAKGDRDELAIQAATELGVDRIVPWQASRSVSRWDSQKVTKGLARWRTIVREAAKQAHRAWVPEVSEPVGTAGLAALPGRLLVLEPTASARLSQVELAGDDDIVLIVGPEGGIAAEELALLGRAGAGAVRLGDSILRTSTAGPAALALVNARLDRW